jgi:hypothetical protein
MYSFRYTHVLDWIFDAFAAIAAFRGLTEAFPRVESSVTMLLGALGILGACSVWMTGFVKMPPGWGTLTALIIFLESNVGIIMAAMLAGLRATTALMRFPTPKGARRLCDLMTLYLFGIFLASAPRWHAGQPRPFERLIIIVSIYNGAIFAGLSAFWLFRASDRSEDLLPLVWAPAVERPKAELLQMEGGEEISRLLGPAVKGRESSSGA